MAAIGLGSFWAKLKLRCGQKVEDHSDYIMGAKVTDYADYRERVGFVKGIRWALDEGRNILGEDDRPPPEPEDDD